jgi:hypothetical protein
MNPHSPSPMLLVFDSHITQVHVFVQATLNKGGEGGKTMDILNTHEHDIWSHICLKCFVQDCSYESTELVDLVGQNLGTEI